MDILILFILILVNGIFSMSEIALVSAKKARLEQMANKGDEAARIALKLAKNPGRFFSAVQIGITLTGILLGLVSGGRITVFFAHILDKSPLLKPYSQDLAIVIVVLILTYFTLVLGELVPKRIGLGRPERIAKAVSPLMNFISIITFPFIWLLTISSNAIVKLFHIQVTSNNTVTEEDIKALIDEGTSSGMIEETEQEIIERVFHLGDRNITSLMTHRTDMIWIEVNDSREEIRRMIASELHSIYPVCEQQIDHLLGVIYIKDLYQAAEQTPIRDLLKKPVFVPEGNSAYQLMELFKQTKVHFAFIVDEYGSLQGMITVNDIMEAILGDMPEPDEKDYEIIKGPDDSWLVDAQIPFYDFLTYFEKEDWLGEISQDFDTLAGFILHYLEHIPQIGEKLDWRGFSFLITSMDGHRIDQISVKLSKPSLPSPTNPV